MNRADTTLPRQLSEKTQFEKLNCKIFKSSTEIASYVAGEIASLIRSRAEENKHCVLGLATGSTPVGVYDELAVSYTHLTLPTKRIV